MIILFSDSSTPKMEKQLKTLMEAEFPSASEKKMDSMRRHILAAVPDEPAPKSWWSPVRFSLAGASLVILIVVGVFMQMNLETVQNSSSPAIPTWVQWTDNPDDLDQMLVLLSDFTGESDEAFFPWEYDSAVVTDSQEVTTATLF